MPFDSSERDFAKHDHDLCESLHNKHVMRVRDRLHADVRHAMYEQRYVDLRPGMILEELDNGLKQVRKHQAQENIERT